MSNSNIEDRVKKIIVDMLGVKPEDVVPEASFVDDLGADSLDTVELVMALEEEFDIYLTDFSGLGVRKVATSIDELFDKMTDKNLFKEVEPLYRQEPYPAIFECIEELYYEK